MYHRLSKLSWSWTQCQWVPKSRMQSKQQVPIHPFPSSCTFSRPRNLKILDDTFQIHYLLLNRSHFICKTVKSTKRVCLSTFNLNACSPSNTRTVKSLRPILEGKLLPAVGLLFVNLGSTHFEIENKGQQIGVRNFFFTFTNRPFSTFSFWQCSRTVLIFKK